MIKYLIVDDEPIAHDIIQKYCELIPSMKLMYNCYDALEALEFLNKNHVDLIFLDLNMPKLKGFAFLKTLSHPPKIIVTTAYKEFALEGYELNVVDYLLKPFSFERFLMAVNKASASSIRKEDGHKEIDESINKTIFLKSNKKHIQLEINKILFLESAGNYVKVVTNEEVVLVRDKISSLLKQLPESLFVKVHKSFAIAIAHINSIEGNRVFIENHEIPIGKMHRNEIQELLKRNNDN